MSTHNKANKKSRNRRSRKQKKSSQSQQPRGLEVFTRETLSIIEDFVGGTVYVPVITDLLRRDDAEQKESEYLDRKEREWLAYRDEVMEEYEHLSARKRAILEREFRQNFNEFFESSDYEHDSDDDEHDERAHMNLTDPTFILGIFMTEQEAIQSILDYFQLDIQPHVFSSVHSLREYIHEHIDSRRDTLKINIDEIDVNLRFNYEANLFEMQLPVSARGQVVYDEKEDVHPWLYVPMLFRPDIDTTAFNTDAYGNIAYTEDNGEVVGFYLNEHQAMMPVIREISDEMLQMGVLEDYDIETINELMDRYPTVQMFRDLTLEVAASTLFVLYRYRVDLHDRYLPLPFIPPRRRTHR